jgi:hypothetical protein
MNCDVLMVSPFQGSGLLVTANLGLRSRALASAQAIALRAFSPPTDPCTTYLTSASESSKKARAGSRASLARPSGFWLTRAKSTGDQ